MPDEDLAVMAPPERSFTAVAEDVPTTHTRIRLTDPHGTAVGSIEVISQLGGTHLVAGQENWWRPDGLTAEEVPAHFAAVAARLMDEVVAMADRLGVSLSSAPPPGLLNAEERLAERGFRRAGDLWFRQAPSRVAEVDDRA